MPVEVLNAVVPAVVPGWYGKMPALGDFAARRLPHEFVKPWDQWLQNALSTSKTLLADRWVAVYMSSPVWRFALLPGVLDHRIWAGVLTPSVDKVGRHFPLTIALPLVASASMLATVCAAHPWYSAIEKAALDALDVNRAVEELEADLQRAAFPDRLDATEETSVESLVDWWLGEAPMSSTDLEGPEAMTVAMSHCAYATLAAGSPGKSLWWSSHVQGAGARLHGYDGLPIDSGFTALLQGLPVGS